MKLANIYLESIVSSNVQIIPYDEDGYDTDYDQWVVADQAEKIANDSGIRIARNKTLAYFARVADDVVGAVWSDVYEDTDQDVQVYDFDMAIDKSYRNQVGIFLRLMDAAMKDYRYLRSDFPQSYIRVWVVNPRLVGVLERRYGFELEDEHGGGTAHMVYYGD
jgi:hypothetical protein